MLGQALYFIEEGFHLGTQLAGISRVSLPHAIRGITRHLESGHIAVRPLDTAELSPREFARRVRRTVEATPTQNTARKTGSEFIAQQYQG